jgi:hypothetical protein
MRTLLAASVLVAAMIGLVSGPASAKTSIICTTTAMS